jgi:hypothetical protein
MENGVEDFDDAAPPSPQVMTGLDLAIDGEGQGEPGPDMGYESRQVFENNINFYASRSSVTSAELWMARSSPAIMSIG